LELEDEDENLENVRCYSMNIKVDNTFTQQNSQIIPTIRIEHNRKAKSTYLGVYLKDQQKELIIQLLKENQDIFATQFSELRQTNV
ncbi:5150_t:CDS:2, partial [Cetraspora pellucida]